MRLLIDLDGTLYRGSRGDLAVRLLRVERPSLRVIRRSPLSFGSPRRRFLYPSCRMAAW